RAEAPDGAATGQHRGPPRRAARQRSQQRSGHDRDEVDQGQHSRRRQARARVEQVSSVQGQRPHARTDRERGPRRQSEVGMDDVVAPPAFARAGASWAKGAARAHRGARGLTVLHELLVALPQEDFLYLGDTRRFPYGERTPGELSRFSAEIADELVRRGTKLLVVACNSATAAALPDLQRRMMETTLGVDVLGVVRPGALREVAAPRRGRIGLLGAPRTVASG